MEAVANNLAQHLAYVHQLVQQGGPNPGEYQEHLSWHNQLNAEKRAGIWSEKDLHQIRTAFGEAFSPQTLQGFVFHRPHGYPGDFEIIEKIYTRHISKDPKLRKYDLFFQAQSAPKAVRNRKQYFKSILKSKIDQSQEPVSILNLASGPCRGVAEFLEENPHAEFHMDCLEIDANAIAYARSLLGGMNSGRIKFIKGNVFRFIPDQQYDLVWSAGLFDYFDNQVFEKLLRRFLGAVTKSGEMIVGNFQPANPTVHYMEALANWHLHHRDPRSLKQLLQKVGANDFSIESEPEGINLFIRIKA